MGAESPVPGMAINLSRTISMGRCRAGRAVASASGSRHGLVGTADRLAARRAVAHPGPNDGGPGHAGEADQGCDQGDGP